MYNKYKFFTILYKLGLVDNETKRKYWGINSILMGLYQKEYWLSIWEDAKGEVDEKQQLRNAAVWYHKNKKAVFAFDNKLYSDEQAVKFGLLKIKYTSETLQTQDSTFKKFAFGDKNNVIGDTKNKEWTITAESKKINGYLCYKAEQNDIIINSVGTFKHQITAWFCPEIPYSFGPLKFGGLPGLILELQTKDGVFGLEKLIFEKNTTIDVESFKQNQIISNQEMSKIIKERREAMKNQE